MNIAACACIELQAHLFAHVINFFGSEIYLKQLN